jgi:molybdopterin-binding protein
MVYDAANVLRGEVKAIIKPKVPGEAEKVLIAIQTGEEPNQEIRIANTLTNAQGETVALKRGAALHLVIKPKPKASD